MVFILDENKVIPIGNTIDEYLENQKEILDNISNSIKNRKLSLNKLFQEAGLDPRNINHKVLYYGIASGLYSALYVSLDINKDIEQEKMSNKLTIKKFIQDYVDLLNQTLIADIDKNMLISMIHRYCTDALFEKYVTVTDDSIITKVTDLPKDLYNAVLSNKDKFNGIKFLTYLIVTNN